MGFFVSQLKDIPQDDVTDSTMAALNFARNWKQETKRALSALVELEGDGLGGESVGDGKTA